MFFFFFFFFLSVLRIARPAKAAVLILGGLEAWPSVCRNVADQPNKRLECFTVSPIYRWVGGCLGSRDVYNSIGLRGVSTPRGGRRVSLRCVAHELLTDAYLPECAVELLVLHQCCGNTSSSSAIPLEQYRQHS